MFFGALVVTALMSSIFVPVSPSDARDFTATLTASGYQINLTTASQLGINLSTTADGVYGSAKDTVNIKTNAPNYSLYLSMDNDDTNGNRLYKDGSNTATDFLAPTTGTFSAPAVLDNNSWGFAIAGDGGTFDTSYQTPTPAITSKWAAVPLKNDAIVIHTSAAPNLDPGDNIDIYYGVKANTSLASGIYSGTINYAAVTSGVPTDIASIAPNRTNQLTGGQQVDITTTLSVTAANAGTVEVIIGGKTCANPTTRNGSSGNLIISCTAPGQDETGFYDVVIDVPDYNKTYYIANGLEYYQEAPGPDITTLTYMHEMTPESCAATATPAVTDTTVPQVTLIDVRGKDGTGTIENPATGNNEQTYVVRKLADGNCWMVQNLNMVLNTGVTLNSTTSDLSAGRTWAPQNNTQTAVGTVWAQDGGDVARSMEPGESLYFPNGVGTGTADTYDNLTGSATGQPWEHVGNYYNWYAATAGTGTAAMTEGQSATDSICPKNWKLPDNSGTKSFLNLVTTTYGLQDNNAADSTKILQAPLNFVRDGRYYWSNGQVYYKGMRGFWWSTAVAQSATNAYYLAAYPSRVIPQSSSYKGHGITVRCVAR